MSAGLTGDGDGDGEGGGDRPPALLVTADGLVFTGEAAGAPVPVATGELVFNTAMSGYQEVITDPSYAGQVIAFTSTHIGNYGTNAADDEAVAPHCRGIVVCDLAGEPSNWRATEGLEPFLRRHGIPALTGVDTRRLARHVRQAGAIPCAFGSAPERELRTAAAAAVGTDGMDLVTGVTTSAVSIHEGTGAGEGSGLRIVAYDFGVKTTMVQLLTTLGTVTVVPAGTGADDVLALEPDGVFLSNGPGDPAALPGPTAAVADLVGRVPVFGICLGHQILATALGGSTYKLPFGHHGANHPVQRLETGVVEITSQNHNYAVAAGSIPDAETTHVNLNDGVIEGFRSLRAPAFSVQYHPEAAPGPHDAALPVRRVPRAHAGPPHPCRRRRRRDRGALMPRRDDLRSILVIGSGPIVIGQACEFDYSGTQACRVLAEEGYRVILANSNPATIMTDPATADRTYVEPLDPEVLTAIIEKERPDALLPTLGGQTALNLTMELVELGVLERFGVEVIGARPDAISTAEDRDRFKAAMEEIGLEVPRSGFAHSLQEAEEIAADIGFPIMVRPSFILGGKGTGIAEDAAHFGQLAAEGLAASPVGQILVERSIAGWKEYELEVMRDAADNCVVVCSIENFDPMGVHTGDSITVAPAQTLTDVEYQAMRDDAFACLRRVGVETGGSNVQFAVEPSTGRRVIIEMNPRVSRSSALASKATGFPIAKIAARLAVGYLLNEIPNDITKATPASFEPTIDYVVTKIPRWAFEKLPGADGRLGTRMQSVGEVMAIGRTFCESLQKALRSLEQGRAGLNADPAEAALDALSREELLQRIAVATPERIFELEATLRRGVAADEVVARTGIDPWFVRQLERLVAERQRIAAASSFGAADFRRAKRLGFSDAQLAFLRGGTAADMRAARLSHGVRPTFKTVDTCAGEFEAFTPYHYATYEEEDEIRPSERSRVIILGSGPNRIGQGIEFDYCCVHASMTLRDAGYETVMINCNPETVSTDYDTSDRLYFEPLTDEDVANVLDAELAAGGTVAGVIVSLGGQTPLKLAGSLPPELVLGTSPASIDLAEDRERWNALCHELGIPQPSGGTATTTPEALSVAAQVGYPVLLRPSYVLGGRAMEIVYDDDGVRRVMQSMTTGALAREGGVTADRPVLVDRFLEDATEVDVDAVRDRTGEVLIAGVMEHVEEAGVHSGDSACALPPQTLRAEVIDELERHTRALARSLDVCGLINVQFAVKDGQVYVLEANPRASRTVPFVAKATGVPLAMVASRVMVGQTLADLRQEGLLRADVIGRVPVLDHVSVKEAVLPFDRFPGVDTLLGPEMRSTGEVMGVDSTFGLAFAKSQMASGTRLPDSGTVFLSLADRDKPAGLEAARAFSALGFSIAATLGTAGYLRSQGLVVDTLVAKVGEEGVASDAVELIAQGKVQLVVNTPRGPGPAGRRPAHPHRLGGATRCPVSPRWRRPGRRRQASPTRGRIRCRCDALQDLHPTPPTTGTTAR